MQVPPIAGFSQKFDSNPHDRTKPVANYRQHSNAGVRVQRAVFHVPSATQISLFRFAKNWFTFTFA
jgi:hypothetical protein